MDLIQYCGVEFDSLSCALALGLVLANIELRPPGWLDRMVLYQKEKFLRDVNEEAPVVIKAEIKPCPPDFVDSPDWDEESVTRLLTLLDNSPDARPVSLALRRMMMPNRRFMSRQESFKHFPSLSKDLDNYFYYAVDSQEYTNMFNGTEELYYLYGEAEQGRPGRAQGKARIPGRPIRPGRPKNVRPPGQPKPGRPGHPNEWDRWERNAIVVISNPVEARLPSAQISVRLLKKIMEARAIAARIMPNTTRVTPLWITQASSGGTVGGNDTDDATTAGDGADDGGEA